MSRPFATARGLLAVGMVLAVPFLLRPRGAAAVETGDAVVVITPHNEAIRHEIERGFREHMRAVGGRAVRVDWRVPGGTSEIGRFLASEYVAAFERHWTTFLRRPWTAAVARAFANPAIDPHGTGPDPRDERLARATFLDSNVGMGADVLFGGGSTELAAQASAGRLVDSGIVAKHPELFGEAIAATVGGERYWDEHGRWIGACLSGYGICFNQDVLDRLGIEHALARWRDLADPRLFGQVALADPSRSGSAVKAFEMVIQQEMNDRLAELNAVGDDPPLAAAAAPSLDGEGRALDGERRAARENRAAREGWARAMRLIRRIAANARYFTDAATKIPLEVSMGDAAAGMCIDFYGRFQSGGGRMGFVMPKGGTSIGADPIGLLRGAPHRDLAIDFMEFVLSLEGQKLWDFRVGTPGGPERYALRRLPILPALYQPEFRPLRADPDDNPYEQARVFTYRPAWTGPLFGAIAFVVRVMCVDAQDDLARAWRALDQHGSPPRALARFDDVDLVDYSVATGAIRSTLAAGRPFDEAALATRLVEALRSQYREVVDLARKGQ